MNSMNPKVIKTNVKGLKPLCNDNLPFGRKIDIFRALKEWRQDPQTKSAWLSQKRKSFATALREFKDLYDAKEYFAEFGKNDDSFQIFYRT
ncbi:hypothetical protein [Marinobacter shengliensis]|uniref:hypothetical protein n=1 Tax=Marinobacter shengliensis TaxID=1389223 RepID=UPI001107EBC6|nr:hypothetical protein [Marinobacter shengliensis]